MITSKTKQIYSLQRSIAPELKEVQQTTQTAQLVSFKDKSNRYLKHYLSDQQIKRANKPGNATSKTSVISKTTQAVVAIARQKLLKTRTEWFMSDIYMAKVTKCGKRQNRNIIAQINGTKFNINRCRKRKGWVIKPLSVELAKGKNISELEYSVSVDIQSFENIPYKNNNSKRIRSNTREHVKLNFSSNISNCSNSAIEQVKTLEHNDSTTESINPKVLVSKKKFNSNTRKKPTSAELKASRTKVYKFNQYDEPKSLADHYPLSSEDAYELQKRSGKAYNLNAMNEILLSMSRKPKESKHMFESKARFMSYMTKAYKNEGRDVNLVNNPTFKIIKGRPQTEVVEILTLNQRESYMKKEEDAGIHNRTDYTQFRARIAGGFPINLGYDLLSNMIAVKKKDSVFEITMHKQVHLSEHYEQCLLGLVKGIGGYTGVNELEFVEVFG